MKPSFIHPTKIVDLALLTRSQRIECEAAALLQYRRRNHKEPNDGILKIWAESVAKKRYPFTVKLQ